MTLFWAREVQGSLRRFREWQRPLKGVDLNGSSGHTQTKRSKEPGRKVPLNHGVSGVGSYVSRI
jgi:hypothetical protein